MTGANQAEGEQGDEDEAEGEQGGEDEAEEDTMGGDTTEGSAPVRRQFRRSHNVAPPPVPRREEDKIVIRPVGDRYGIYNCLFYVVSFRTRSIEFICLAAHGMTRGSTAEDTTGRSTTSWVTCVVCTTLGWSLGSRGSSLLSLIGISTGLLLMPTI